MYACIVGGIMEGRKVEELIKMCMLGQRKYGGLLDKTVARQGALSDFSLLKSCILILYITETDIAAYLDTNFLIKKLPCPFFRHSVCLITVIYYIRPLVT